MDSRFLWVGDLLCIDFVNSSQIIRHQQVDFVSDLPGLLQFLLESGTITPGIQTTLEKDWSSFEKNRAVSAAHSFRATLRKLVSAILEKGDFDAVTSEINESLSFQSGYNSIVKSTTGFELKMRRDFTLPDHLLVPIAESAAWLICHGDWKLVKTCSNPECGLFFYDVTKNHLRRWCSMQTCGNRSKVDAYLKRKLGNSVQEL
jgi:predicted RNA-binding Zn ribbon-like protein